MLNKFFLSKGEAPQHFVGIDLGTHAVKAVVVQHSHNGSPKLVCMRTFPLINQPTLDTAPLYSISKNPSFIEPGGYEADNPTRLRTHTDCLRSLLEGTISKLPIERCVYVVAINSQEGILKSFSLPFSGGNKLRDALRAEIEEWMPGVSNNLVVDYEILPSRLSQRRKPDKLEILAAITKDTHLQQLNSLLSEVGIKPQIIDLEWCALINALSTNYPESNLDISIILDIGASSCKVLVVEYGQPVFVTRMGPQGGGFVGEVSEVSNAFRFRNSSYGSRESSDSVMADSAQGRANQLLAVINESLKELLINYLKDPRCKIVYLTGGLTYLEEIPKRIMEILGKPVTELNPFKIFLKNRGEIETHSSSDSPLNYKQFAVATALALRGHS